MCDAVYGMTPGETDPLAMFRQRLQSLYTSARKPTYRTLEAHAAQDGKSLCTSTVSDLLNGPSTPRWDTVETFVRACARYAQAHQVGLAPQQADVARWHDRYQAMRSALADKAAPKASPKPSARRGHPVVPAQLPAAAPFTGRTEHLAALDKWLRKDGTGDHPATLVISAIDGTAGVGKTALAVHWAYRVADRFPDGQLYVNLRGFDPGGQVLEPVAAVRGFLDALGVPAQKVPAEPDAQTSLYRSLLASRRMLIVLDNARDTAQVRPLLPGRSGCVVVVTSRNQLTGLVAEHGAHPVALDVLTPDEARDLLAQRLGAERIAAEPDAVAEIITRCARLPLALALFAAHATIRPQVSLRSLANQLTSGRVLVGNDPATDVHSVFSWSCRTLTPPAARLFRLLGLHPGPDITAPAAASLCALPLDKVGPLLDDLWRANLVAEPVPGRFAMHDLLRTYATHLTETTDPEQERRDAVRRVLDHYLRSAYAAGRLLNPNYDAANLPPLSPGATAAAPADGQQALAWFRDEHAVLLAALDRAATGGYDAHVWQLAWSMSAFLDRAARWDDHEAVARAALAAAARLGDLNAQARAHRMLGNTHSWRGNFDDARAQLLCAMRLYQQSGDRLGQARNHQSLGYLADRQGRTEQALEHASAALDLFRAADDEFGQGNAYNNIGWCHTRLGEHERAIAACEQALALLRRYDDKLTQAHAWDTIGYAHFHLGHHPKALACYETALGLLREVGGRYQEAVTTARAGDVHLAAGDRRAAGEAYQRALPIFIDLDHSDADGIRKRLADLRSPAAEGV